MTLHRSTIYDYAKGIGIILVVYGHIARGVYNAGLPIDSGFYTTIDRIIYSFHMPLFFFVSGCLFLKSIDSGSVMGFVSKKGGTIIYPYIIWSIVQGLLSVMFSDYTNTGLTYGQVFSLLWQPQGQFWFLYMLFSIFAFSALVYRESSFAWSIFVLAFSILYYLIGYSPADIYLLNNMPKWFVWFALGVCSGFYLPKIHQLNYGLLVGISTLFVFFQYGLAEGFLSHSADYAPLANLVVGFLGIILVLLLSQFAAKCKWSWLEYIGRRSMEIYLIHVLAGSGARIILQKLLGVTHPQLHLVVGTLCGVLIPIAISVTTQRYGIRWLFTWPTRVGYQAR